MSQLVTPEPPKKRLKQLSIENLLTTKTFATLSNSKDCETGNNFTTKNIEAVNIPSSSSNKSNSCPAMAYSFSQSPNSKSDMFITTRNVSKGKRICDMNQEPKCSPKLGPFQSSPSHSVLCEIAKGQAKSLPGAYTDKWDQDHVRLPCSPESLYPITNDKNESILTSRWKLVKASLSSSITSGKELADAIFKYNSRFKDHWDFAALTTYLDKVLSYNERQLFFGKTLPAMVKLALDLPEICTQPIPLLRTEVEHRISMSQKQVASLLANAFFCTFPRRNTRHGHSEYSSFPEINFPSLFNSLNRTKFEKKYEKFKCLINYFKRVTDREPTGVLTFQRKCMTSPPNWANSKILLSDVHIASDGVIEEQDGMLQVDFANKFVGGGVLRNGCVQEEIHFLLHPELIITRLFTEVLKENEALVIIGCERFNDTSGYADTFLWKVNHTDRATRDEWCRLNRHIVAIDAVRFPSKNSIKQYEMTSIHREANKAFAGFSEPSTQPENLSAIVTGNWGCGAFNGDVYLKFLIQLMAASCSKREMIYFTFHDAKLCQGLYDMYSLLKSKDLVVGDVYKLIENYQTLISKMATEKKKFKISSYPLFEYLFNKFINEDNMSSTDDDERPPSSSKPSKPAQDKGTSENTKDLKESNDENKSFEFFDESDDDAWLETLYGAP